MKQTTITLLLLGLFLCARGQLNVQLLHQLVQHSKDENGRQKLARDRQLTATENEEVNRSQMQTLKNRVNKLLDRFSILSLAIDAGRIGIRAQNIIGQITIQQKRIIQLAQKKPLLLGLAISAEDDIAENVYQLSSYLYALSLSIGDINQMKQSDRKVLFEHIVNELRVIEGSSRGLATLMFYTARKKTLDVLNPFAHFIDRDKQIISNILFKIKILHDD